MPEELNKIEQNNQSYISHVRLKGYKSIIDTEVELKPGLNIIIGANGSGKTNFVEFLDKILNNEFNEISPTYLALIKFLYNDSYCVYEIDHIMVKPAGFSGQIDGIKEKFIVDNNIRIESDKYQNLYKIANLVEWDSIKAVLILFGIPEEFSRLLNINKFEIIKAYINDIPTYFSTPQPLLTNGLNNLLFEIFIAFFTENDLNNNQYFLPFNYENSIKKYTPIKEIKISSNYNIELLKDKLTIEGLKFEFLINDRWLTWNQLSDGTKRMFYIITEITFANNVVILEEPELGIHPDQLRKLMSFLREQTEEKQIILTTHSPQVLNILDPDDLDRIIISKYDKEKGTQLYHLTEEEMEHARGYMEAEGLFLSDYWVYSGFDAEKEREEV